MLLGVKDGRAYIKSGMQFMSLSSGVNGECMLERDVERRRRRSRRGHKGRRKDM